MVAPANHRNRFHTVRFIGLTIILCILIGYPTVAVIEKVAATTFMRASTDSREITIFVSGGAGDDSKRTWLAVERLVVDGTSVDRLTAEEIEIIEQEIGFDGRKYLRSKGFILGDDEDILVGRVWFPSQAAMCWFTRFAILLPVAIAVALVLYVFTHPSVRKVSPGACPQCDYDLRGGDATSCPECGWNRDIAAE